jgi:hypothetical protein
MHHPPSVYQAKVWTDRIMDGVDTLRGGIMPASWLPPLHYIAHESGEHICGVQCSDWDQVLQTPCMSLVRCTKS